jgi:DivIVA domain-containing protein
VALDRQSIEKKDFPVGRRGYDPEAVDAHLSTLADEIADYKRSARRRSDTLASSASEQVRAIVEAAETSAADIQRDAERDAREIRDEANSEAQATREQATEEAREYVGKVSEATNSMLQRVDAMESELGALVDSLRTGSNRLNADLQLLESNLSEVSDVVKPRLRFEPEPEPEPEQAAEPEPEPAPEPEPEQPDASSAAAEEAAAADPEKAKSGESQPADGGDDAEGARLIALNMALNGTPRDETARYLSENFQLSDRDALLDEVYASVEG